MDFETEFCTRESVEDNDITNVRNNGDDNKLSSADKNGGGFSVESGNSGCSIRKGYGLKKWRRIRRNFGKDGGVDVEVDNEKVLKRGLPGSAVGNSVNPLQIMTEGSVGSKSFGVYGSGFVAGGADSENGEKKNRIKSLSGKKIGGTQAQRNQQGKNRIESTKKLRGERVKIEEEMSHSSIESDSGSYNFLYMQSASSVNSNGKQSGRSMNYDSREHGSGQKNGHEEENTREFEDISRDDNHRTEQEPLINSILSLQLVQETLEKEVQKLAEVGNDLNSVLGHPSYDDAASVDLTSVKTKQQELSSSNENGSDKVRQHASSSLQTKAVGLTEDVKVLKSKLKESRNMLEVKEPKISELEATLNLSRSLKEECRSTMDMQQEKYREFETELEGLFRQRIEAEVEYLAIIKTLEKMKFVAVDNNSVVKEQSNQDWEEKLVGGKLEEAKEKAVELENCSEDITGTEEVMKLQRKVCKAASCFSIELILLLLVVWLFVLQLNSRSGAFVPT